MIGRVDEEGRALVTIRMGAAENDLVHEVDVWVDTGYDCCDRVAALSSLLANDNAYPVAAGERPFQKT